MSKDQRKLNDIAWEKLDNRYKINNEIQRTGYMEISSKQINEFREARLMTKFDQLNNLPDFFKNNNLSILPITRGTYVIGDFEAYHSFEKIYSKPVEITAPKKIESINFDNLTSEAMVINAAYLSGILSDFIGDEDIKPTVNGRMSSNRFRFSIKSRKNKEFYNFGVENSQLEIDGGYEGKDSLMLIEAKNYISDDFLVRQLYYPFRLWNDRIVKSVKNIFLTYTNGLFTLYDYDFAELENYNSLILIKKKNYILNTRKINKNDIIEIFKETNIDKSLSGITFPQADNFDRIINICEILFENYTITKSEVTLNYDFDPRQTNYYIDACRYLNLVEKSSDGEIHYRLSNEGLKLFNVDMKNRNLYFIKKILEKEVFFKTFEYYLNNGEVPNKRIIVDFMKEANIDSIKSEVTFMRRASTVTSWINWIVKIYEQ